jgi:nitrate/nitrite transporter NarK
MIAVVAGSLLGGSMSDRLLLWTGSRRIARKWLAAGSVAACAGLTLAAYPIEQAWLAVLLISAGSFFAGVSGPCAYTITIDMGGRHVAAVFSVMNAAGNVGAALFPMMVPKLVQWAGWEPVLLLFTAVYVAACVCWLLLDTRGTVGAPRSRIA